ncbi:MAG: hypothetical protein KC635_04575, partial [Myxococcales bacterium]|nr:hypothetical protein [Myxococcales bacterium]
MDEPRPTHRTAAELEAGLGEILRSPPSAGDVRMIVRRPARDERETVAVGQLDPEEGLVGDSFRARELAKRPAARPEIQLTLMNARAIALIAGDEARWPLAGDQLYVDLDLSWENLPP